MHDVKTFEGRLSADGGRFGIVAARFNDFIVSKLVDGAIDALKRHGANSQDIELAWVPGAWELPVIAEKFCASRRYDAVITLGAVIRGSTPHFDYVSGGCARGIGAIAERHSMPVVFGVLTVDTIEQAIERAGTKAGNKGAEAAVTAIEMVNLIRQLDG
ncbi:MAG: 6,7-dimethyl-8-ribityllumazine synthase [Pseudomonadota bacterium]